MLAPSATRFCTMSPTYHLTCRQHVGSDIACLSFWGSGPHADIRHLPTKFEREPMFCCHRGELLGCSLVKTGSHEGRCVFTAKDLTHMSPSRAGFLQLRSNCLDAIVVLRHQPTKILEYFNSFKDIPANRELMAKGQSRWYRCLALLASFHPNLAFFRLHMVGVKGVDLHAAPFALWIASLLGDYNEIFRMNIPKILSQHPSVAQTSQKLRIRAGEAPRVQPGADCVHDRGSKFQQFLGNHCLLVYVVDICQVAAEGACLHLLPTRVAHNMAWVPFTRCDPPHLHPAVWLCG